MTCVSNKNNFSDIFYEIKKISLTKCEFNILINNPPKGQEFESKKRYKFLCNIFPEFNISNLVFAILSIGFDEFSEDITNDISFYESLLYLHYVLIKSRGIDVSDRSRLDVGRSVALPNGTRTDASFPARTCT